VPIVGKRQQSHSQERPALQIERSIPQLGERLERERSALVRIRCRPSFDPEIELCRLRDLDSGSSATADESRAQWLVP
jgi:hypothetical protein